eukprot:Phypoly_transcript_06900.p1 GENE.Phypoly_transcript_06900~~Phypoly_transcript_06900.p1  ORF type:complete len:528 (+),score=139.98 Phypoly_transcript_06900:95-1678(+)
MDKENVISPFKQAVEQLISVHVHETNELRKLIEENEVRHRKKQESWQKEKDSLTSELEKLKKDKHELRGMLKKAQVLLDKYRSQLRNQLQDNISDENENAILEQAKGENTDDRVSTPKSKKDPHAPDCYIIIDSDIKSPKQNKQKTDANKTPHKKETKKTDKTSSTDKTDKPNKSNKTERSDETPTKTKDTKEKKTSPKVKADEQKGDNIVQPIDLSIDEPTTNFTSNNKKNTNNNSNNIRKSNEYKLNTNYSTPTKTGEDLLDDLDAAIQNANENDNDNNNTNIYNNINNNTNTTPKPMKTKYNKYNLTPIAKTTPDNKTPKSAQNTPTNTKPKSNNTSPINDNDPDFIQKTKSAQNTPTNTKNGNKNNDNDTDFYQKTNSAQNTPTNTKNSNKNTSPNNDDSDFYQKIYDQFSKTSAKRLADDLDFDDSSPPNAKPSTPNIMPPPPAPSTKKFKYVEVVRNKEERAALPAHECDQCKKFYEALGDGYDINKMVQYCSRHRSRDVIPDTPPDYWQMSFPSSETQDN